MPTTQTHESRQPVRVVGNIESKLSARYAMASVPVCNFKRFWNKSTTRFDERAVFARRQPSGLDIS